MTFRDKVRFYLTWFDHMQFVVRRAWVLCIKSLKNVDIKCCSRCLHEGCKFWSTFEALRLTGRLDISFSRKIFDRLKNWLLIVLIPIKNHSPSHACMDHCCQWRTDVSEGLMLVKDCQIDWGLLLAPMALAAIRRPPPLILHSDIYLGGLQFHWISTVAQKYFDALPCFPHDMQAMLSRNCKYISFNPNVPCLNVILTNSMQNITFW